MKRGKSLLSSLRLAESFHITRSSPSRSLHIQVTQFPNHSPLFSLSNRSNFSITINKLHFSSKPDLITTNEWSNDLEKTLEKSKALVTYEVIMYVLMSLEKNPRKALGFFDWVNDKSDYKPDSMVYGLMLRILAKEECLEEFRVFIERIEKEGCGVDERTHLIVLKSLTDALNGDGVDKEKMSEAINDWNRFYKKVMQEFSKDVTVESVVDVIVVSDSFGEMKKKLGELGVSLSESTILKIFWKLYGSPLKVLCFFRWLNEHMGYKHNAITYNAILRILGQKASVKEFWNMVKELKSAGYEIDIDTYGKLVNKFQRSGMLTDAVELYEMMMDGPYSSLARDCSTLLRVISMNENPDLDLVSRVVKKYEAKDGILSKESYDRIYKSLVTVSKFDEAKKTLDAMKNAGFEPDLTTYSQGTIGLRRAGKLEEAMNIVEEMDSKGYDLGLSNWHFLIRKYCKAGEAEKALESFRRLVEVNPKFDKQLMEELVDCLCDKRVNDAYTLVTDMVNRRPMVRPSLVTFQKVAEQFLREKKLEEGLNVLRVMKKYNYSAPRDIFVNYISKFGTVDNAIVLLNEMIVNDHPSPASYIRLFEAFIKEGRRSEATDLLYKCPDHIRQRAYVVNLFASQGMKDLQKAKA
ncbi:hypothetical protein ACHQM5_011039 [Ranunculus cassubicifolius]